MALPLIGGAIIGTILGAILGNRSNRCQQQCQNHGNFPHCGGNRGGCCNNDFRKGCVDGRQEREIQSLRNEVRQLKQMLGFGGGCGDAYGQGFQQGFGGCCGGGVGCGNFLNVRFAVAGLPPF